MALCYFKSIVPCLSFQTRKNIFPPCITQLKCSIKNCSVVGKQTHSNTTTHTDGMPHWYVLKVCVVPAAFILQRSLHHTSVSHSLTYWKFIDHFIIQSPWSTIIQYSSSAVNSTFMMLSFHSFYRKVMILLDVYHWGHAGWWSALYQDMYRFMYVPSCTCIMLSTLFVAIILEINPMCVCVKTFLHGLC